MTNWKTSNDSVMNKLFDVACSQKTLVKTSRHATAIVHKNKIISIGVNKLKTHPIMLNYAYVSDKKIFIHSEIDALIKVINIWGPDILKQCELYNLRVTNTNRVGTAKPCQGCMDAITGSKLKRVFWT